MSDSSGEDSISADISKEKNIKSPNNKRKSNITDKVPFC